MKKEFKERRKESRLPFQSKVVYTDGEKVYTAYAANLSRGGLFIMTQDPFPIDTSITLSFCLPESESSLATKGKVAHIVFDRQRCEIENGMGIKFEEMSDALTSILQMHLDKDKKYYLDLRRVLAEEEPDPDKLSECLTHLTTLKHFDLLHLRYRVERICTLLEPTPEETGFEEKLKATA